jgi:Rrf2 family protein
MISTTSKYALKALAYLGALPKGTSVVSGKLAKSTQIPASYLYKILLDLRNAGFLNAARGIGGGYRLRRQPEKIRLIEIVDIFEGSGAEPSCLLGEYRICSDKKPCSAHDTWQDVRDAYVNFLKTTTVASIADHNLLKAPANRIVRKGRKLKHV